MIRGHHFLLISLFIISCEKDDICIEGSENTNRITIGFLDNETKNPTGITLINVKSIEKASSGHVNIVSVIVYWQVKEGNVIDRRQVSLVSAKGAWP